MSAVSSTTSSASVSYATQLAQTSALQRSLYNLGTAVQSGDLTSAGSILSGIISANPQYASTSNGGSSSQDPINQDFQTLANAISNNQTDVAQSAWTQVKSDLAKDGVTNTTDGTSATAELLAQAKSSVVQQIISDTFGTSPGGGVTATSLLTGSLDSSSDAGLSSSLISNWLTYQAGGSTSPSAMVPSTGANLNTTA